MNEYTTFQQLDINKEFCQKLRDLNINSPTKIQTQVIPLLNKNENLLFQSETGTGKTFAYLLPLLQQINKNLPHIQLMIIAPTHELSSQIKNQIQQISDIKVALLIGGAPIKRQTELLKEKPQIVVGGPARLAELAFLKKLKCNNIKFIVIDEVDRLFSPELRDKTLSLLNLLPEKINIIACSATISEGTTKIIKNIIKQKNSDTENLKTVLLPPEDILRKKILHIAIYSESRDKIDTLKKILVAENPSRAMIFTSRPDQVEIISNKLTYKKIDCCFLHAKTDKVKRKQALDRFRSGKTKVLITSDLSARGLDIFGISHIIQMDLPSEKDFFIHRAGRTGRAGNSGTNIVICDEYELRKFSALEKKLGLTVYPKILYKGKMMAPILD